MLVVDLDGGRLVGALCQNMVTVQKILPESDWVAMGGFLTRLY